MGYTHYAYMTPIQASDKWAKLTTAVNKVITGSNLIQREWDDNRPPEIGFDNIRFNGIGDDGHETLYLEREGKAQEYLTEDSKGKRFMFCKTAMKPYDKFVTAVLFLAKVHLGEDIEISSDGDVEDWQEGIQLVNEKLGKNYQMLDNPNAEYKNAVSTAIIKLR
jgi:hypothetical protein